MADNAEVMAGIERKPGRALLGADAEHEGLRGRARRRAPNGPTRSSCSARRARRSASATSTARSPRASSASRRWSPRRTAERHQGARRDLVRARLSVPGRGQRRRGRARGAADEASIGVRPLRRRRHHRRRHAAARCRRALEARAASTIRSTRSAAISTTPTARRWPTSTPASSSASRTFDASVAGLGGCPYAKGATGNVATEDVLFMLRRPGHRHRHRPRQAGRRRGKYIRDVLGRKPSSRAATAHADQAQDGGGARRMCDAETARPLPEGVQRVARALQERAIRMRRVMLDDAARTAQQAADALGIAVGQIAKSIVFRRKSRRRGGARRHLGRPARRREEGRGASVGAARPRRCRLRQGAHRLFDRRRLAGRACHSRR